MVLPSERRREGNKREKGIAHTLWKTEAPFPVLLAWNSVFSWGERCLLHSGGNAVPMSVAGLESGLEEGKGQREFPSYSLENWIPLFLLLLERDCFFQSFAVSTCCPAARVILTPVQIQESKRKKKQNMKLLLLHRLLIKLWLHSPFLLLLFTFLSPQVAAVFMLYRVLVVINGRERLWSIYSISANTRTSIINTSLPNQ